MRLVLHVGAHKTGTTLIQQVLRQRRKALLDTGVFFTEHQDPLALEVRLLNAIRAMSDIPNPGPGISKRFARYFSLVRELGGNSNADVAVMSSEELLGYSLPRSAEEVETIDALYGNAGVACRVIAETSGMDEVIPVLYIREQAGWLESQFRERIKMGGSQSFEEFLAYTDLSKLSWEPVVDQIHDAFGQVLVRRYDLSTVGGVHFVENFLDIVRPGLGKEVDVPALGGAYSNESLSAVGVELARSVNGILSGHDRTKMVTFIQRNFSSATHEKGKMLPESVTAEIKERYAARSTVW